MFPFIEAYLETISDEEKLEYVLQTMPHSDILHLAHIFWPFYHAEMNDTHDRILRAIVERIHSGYKSYPIDNIDALFVSMITTLLTQYSSPDYLMEILNHYLNSKEKTVDFIKCVRNYSNEKELINLANSWSEDPAIKELLDKDNSGAA